MSIYYVSNNGLDTNDGLSPETAWQTIPKMNESIASGDVVKFRCGDVFYGQILLQPGKSADCPTTLTSYGEGKKPTISQYKIINSDAWEDQGDGIWRADIADTTKFTGNVSCPSNNTGFLLVSGEVKPFKKFYLEKLEQNWDFFNDEEKYLYVKCDKNPAQYSDDIRAAIGVRSCPVKDNMRVENIVFAGSGAHGISGIVHGAHIENCEFHNLGGARLGGPERNGKFNTTRYGNGVECWTGSTDVTVKNCKFSGIYDVAFTMQGPMNGQSWRNVHVIGCEMWNNTQCFEIWANNLQGDEGFVDCSFENNTCINSGYCWGYDSRPNKNTACHLLLYGIETKNVDIKVKNNFFYSAYPATVYKSGGAALIPEGYDISDNLIVMSDEEELILHPEEDQTAYNAFVEKIKKNNTVINKNRFVDANTNIIWK